MSKYLEGHRVVSLRLERKQLSFENSQMEKNKIMDITYTENGKYLSMFAFSLIYPLSFQRYNTHI